MSSFSTTSARLATGREKSASEQIFRALLSLASAALLTRMAGMANQVIVSSRFGAGKMMDAYFVASSLPTTAAYIALTALEGAVIPSYAKVRARGETDQTSLLFSTLLNLLLVGTVSFTCMALLFRRQLIQLSAPALDPFRLDLAVSLAPFIFPALTALVIVGLLECILNAEGQFGWPAYAGLLVPLTTGVLVVTAGKSQGIRILCVGMLLGLCLQMCAYFVRARRAKLVYRPALDMRNPAMKSMLIAVWPALLASLIGQASPLIDQVFASLLPTGSISALNYALKFVSVCSGVIFASVGRAALPYLSMQAGNGDMKAFKETLRLYVWVVGVGALLLSALVIVLARPIVQVFFQRGAFTAEDTSRTATTLVGFMVGLSPMSLGIITARAFCALGKTKVLLGVSLFSVVTNAGLDALFARLWQSEGIALATSAVYLCTMCAMLYTLRRTIGGLDLLTPPAAAMRVLEKSGLCRLYLKWETLLAAARKFTVRAAIGSLVFAAGGVAVFLDSLYSLRIALGSIMMLALLRYRYSLVVIWIAVSVVVSPRLPFFANNHILTALTVPTLLLLLYLPVSHTFGRMPPLFYLLLYLLWVFAGISLSAIGVEAFLVMWLTFLDYLAVAALIVQVLPTRRRLRHLIDAMVLGGAFVSIYGIYGYVTGQNGVRDPETSFFRIYSIFSAAPPLALFLSIVIPLALYRAFTLTGFKRVGVSLVTLLLLAASALTFARGAFISIPISLGVMMLYSPSRKMKIGLLAAAAGLAAGVVIFINASDTHLFGRFLSQDVTTLNGRIYLWQAVLEHFQPTQLLGNGLRSSDALLANLRVGFDGNLIATSPSNLFVGTLYDHGIIGLILLTLIFGALITGIIKGMHETKGEQRSLYIAALAIFVSVFLQSFDVNDFWTQAIGVYFWAAMALPYAVCWTRSENSSGEEAPVPGQETAPLMDATRLGSKDGGA